MNYFLDTEFDGPGGPLLSLGLVREDGEALYATLRTRTIHDPWVRENVVPVLMSIPNYGIKYKLLDVRVETLVAAIVQFLSEDNNPNIVVDWPVDIMYFCDLLMPKPYLMVPINSISFLLCRCEPYPTEVPSAVQHNAYWDAMALKAMFDDKGINDNA